MPGIFKSAIGVGLLCAGCLNAQAATIFVNQTLTSGADDGTSWADAFRGPLGLVSALGEAHMGDEIWIAAGRYVPAVPGADRELSFVIPSGVTLLGGFSGRETHADQRDPIAHPGTLSGDLNGNDGPANDGIPANAFDNAHHVIRFAGPGAAIIDGLTIRDGASDSFADHRRGAGVFITGGALTLRGCNLGSSWSSWHGGGVSAENAELTIDRCTLTGMRANMGGGIAVLTGASALIIDSHFLENIGGLGCAVFVGPTVFNGPVGGAATIRRCRFERGNGVIGSNSGGALYLMRAVGAVIEDCDFTNNAVVGGGGAVFIAECEASFDRCHFVANEAPGDGGGAVYVIGNLTFADEGLALATFTNSRFVGNNGVSLSISGGIAEYLNCTFANNSVDGGFLGWPVFFTSFQNGLTFLRNSIIWDNNEDSGIFGGKIFGMEGTLEIERCIVQSWDDLIPGADVIDTDPLFADSDGPDGVPGTEDDDLRPRRESPAIDAANRAVPAGSAGLDLDGLDRAVDDPCAPDLFGDRDLGAYERQIASACAVDHTCDGLINIDDLNAVLAGWGNAFGVDDLNAVLSNWQSACE